VDSVRPPFGTRCNGKSCNVLAPPAFPLVCLSKPFLEGSEADEAAAEGKEGVMDVGPTLVADGQPAEAVEPGERALHHPAVTAEARARVDLLARDADADVALAQGPATAWIVVALIRMQFSGSLAPLSGRGLGQRDGVDHRLKDDRVMAVGATQERGKRDPGAVDHNMALRARFSPIRRIRPRELAPLLAGILAESKEARLQSRRSDSPRRSSSTWCNRSQTPASCQSRSRRQQVTPDPHPNSCGSISQGIPVLSTKMMPVSAARSETRGRPPLGFGGSGGSSGATRAHNSSLTSGFMPQVYHAPTRF